MKKIVEIELPKNARVANKYNRVVEQIRKRILSGEYTGMLPGTKQLAEKYDVSLMTADKAVKVLEREGMVVRLPRKGTVINPISSGRPATLAVVVSDVTFPLTSRLVGQLGRMARDHDIQTLFFQHFDDVKTEVSIVRDLVAANQVDGVVLVQCSRGERGTAAKILLEAKIPVVELGLTRVEGLSAACHTICFDEEAAFRDGTRYLIEQGHSAIALVSPREVEGVPLPENYKKNPRWKGYASAMKSAGLSPQPLVWFDSAKALDRREVSKFMRSIKKYTALFLNHDTFAATVMATLHRQGVHVPNDISLLSHDGAPLAEALDLTTMTRPMEQVAVRAAEILNGCRTGEIKTPVHEVVQAEIAVRGSLASI